MVEGILVREQNVLYTATLLTDKMIMRADIRIKPVSFPITG